MLDALSSAPAAATRTACGEQPAVISIRIGSGNNRLIGASIYDRGIGRQRSRGVFQFGSGDAMIVDGRQAPRTRGSQRHFAAQQFGDGDQTRLMAVLENSVGLFGLGCGSGSNFDSLRGGSQSQISLEYFKVDR